MKRLLTLTILMALAGMAVAQDTMKVVKSDGLVWKEHPVFKGAQITTLIGDPPEVVVQRVKIPPNSKIPRHTHSYAEVITVLRGHYGNAMGDEKGEVLPAGLRIRPTGGACASHLDRERGGGGASQLRWSSQYHFHRSGR